ncbi:hypothetical protein NHX12_018493 [Muraenolepis orangiensis]|uniref:Suppressor of cytokine signaling 1 n=1 Tax=Muraenolepis orangiensis TaxID=630683 RepID=A0A9Q0EWT9_9TELE|nr:hypothetical protein NHX12_018493 [Muraenolepis orangiensis]
MVQDNLERIGVLDPRQNLRPAVLNQYPLRPWEGEWTKDSDKIEPEGKELKDPGSLHWQGFLVRQQSKNENDTASPERVVPDNWPTHYQTFRSQEEYHLVKQTYMFLQHSGFYWGTVSMEEAHHMLRGTPPGTFLIRDSNQCNVFFTLSYQGDAIPTSIRLLLTNQLFSLDGSHKTFDSLFALLAHYITSSGKIVAPYHLQRPERLQQLVRKVVIRTHGAHAIDTLPGVSVQLRDFLCAYPYWV